MLGSANLAVRGKARSSGGHASGSGSAAPSITNGTPPTDAETLQAIIADNATKDSEENSKDFLYENGFRTEFGTKLAPNKSSTEVETNYLEITRRPKKIMVYQIVMVREYQDKKQEDGTTKKVPVVVRKRKHRQGIFETAKQGVARLLSQSSYATDFDLIWSVAPLFQDHDATAVPPPLGRLTGQDPITDKPVKAEHVEIKYDRTLDLATTVAKLFRKQTSASANPAPGDEDNEIEDDPAVLTRGINAFLSTFARVNSTGLTSTNANTFYRNDTASDLDADRCLKVLRGYFQSLRPGAQTMMLNVNVRHSPFMHTSRLDTWMKTCRDRHGRTVMETRGYVIGRVVQVLASRTSVHAPNKFGVITAVGRPDQQKPKVWGEFGDLADLLINIGSTKKGQGLSGRDYFKASELQICDNQPFHGVLTGDQTTAMLNMACQRPKLNRDLILNDGLHMFGISTPTGRQCAAGFGLEVSQSLMKVPARILSAPALQYRSGKLGSGGSQNISLASWDLRNVKVFNNGQLPHLPVLDLSDLHQFTGAHDDRRGDLSKLQIATQNAFSALGIARADLELVWRTPKYADDDKSMKIRESRLLKLIGDALQGSTRPTLVILPKHDYDLYSKVKRTLDRLIGVQSACAVNTKLHGFGFERDKGRVQGVQYMSNIGLKMNLKNAGDNQRVDVSDLKDILMSKASQHRGKKSTGVSLTTTAPKCETIIIGADVAHPTASAITGCPSIVAVVGSVDDNFVKYPGSMRLQRSRQEYIADLADMVKERLLDWAAKHENRLPTSMLFYRDGVSESQYDDVRSREIPQLQHAFELAKMFLLGDTKGFSGGSKAPTSPKFRLTFVIVSKRHNTRFYALKEEDTFRSKVVTDKRSNQGSKQGKQQAQTETNWNLKPGFVIDRKITHPYSNDFFLQSHQPLQGTGRSAHYFVLVNQLKLSADDLQQVTHALCYIYARATKGVSYCAPAYYADRLCDRGRAYLRPWLVNFDNFAVDREQDDKFDTFRDRVVEQIVNGGLWIAKDNAAKEKYGQPRKNPWHPNLDGTMFYL